MAQKRECPHCEKWFPPHAYDSHVRVCALRPSDDELRQMRHEGLSGEAIAALIEGVSSVTVKKWLAECGADKIAIRSSWKRVTTIYPEKALRYGHGGGCGRCADIELCAELQDAGERVRCEAPDDDDLADEAARRNGAPRLETVCNPSAWETLFTWSEGSKV